MAENLSFSGLKIVVTRAQAQATQLANSIEERGGSCILFPLLEITPLEDTQPLQALITRLHNFDLAIFISPNAVRYGMQAIRNAGGLPARLRIATIGLSSARALHDYGVKEVISPQLRFDSEALLALPEMQQVGGKHVVIFRGDSGRELLGDTLKLRGAHVEYVSCYHRSKPQLDVAALLAAKPDALCISSSEALSNLWEMLDAANRDLFTDIPLFVSHERIAAAAKKMGWQHIVTATGNDEALLAALATWAESKRLTP